MIKRTHSGGSFVQGEKIEGKDIMKSWANTYRLPVESGWNNPLWHWRCRLINYP